MPTTQSEFQTLASELKAEFADFFKPRVFTLQGSYSPSTGVNDSVSETVDALREDYTAREIDGQSIQANDFKLLVLVSDFKVLTPRIDGLHVSVDEKECAVINAQKDAADAVWTIQVRG